MNVTKLFDYIKVFFENQEEYNKINDLQKAKHYFMLNRFMSIKYPIQALGFSNMRINGSAVSDCWHIVANQYKRVPGWIFTKTKSQTSKVAQYEPDDDVLAFYLKRTMLSDKDYTFLKKMYPEELKVELKALEKQMKTSG